MVKLISFFFPVRKGSKRVKNKNTRKIKKYNFGLLEIKVNHLKKLRIMFKNNIKPYDVEFVFSTNCEKTKIFLNKYNWIKVYDRKKSLSGDDVLDKLVSEVPKVCDGQIIFWSHITSPLFDEKCYLDFTNEFLAKIKIYDSAFSASTIDSFVVNEENKWLSHDRNKKKWPRTQDLKKMFIINNAIFGAKRNVYTKLNDRLGKKILPIVTPKLLDLDIDYLDDIRILKKFI